MKRSIGTEGSSEKFWISKWGGQYWILHGRLLDQGWLPQFCTDRRLS